MSLINRIGAIVVNPKTGEPFFCSSEMNPDITLPNSDYDLRDFNGASQGSGYFETSKSSSYYVSAKKTGYPRVHTPQGVKKKGVGNGTCLYVAGACAVAVVEFREADDLLPIEWNLNTGVAWDDRKKGISSTEQRSEAASKWWESAVQVGLAEEQAIVAAKEHEINDCLYGSTAEDIVSSYWDDDLSENSKTDLNVCASGTYYTGEEVIANVLQYDQAVTQNLVIATFLEPLLWNTDDNANYDPSTVVLPRRVKFVMFNPEAARAVNVGVFREFDDPRAALALYAGICIAGGMNESEIASLRERFDDGFDIQPEAVMGIDDPRKNPTPRTRTDPFAGLVKSYAPARRKNPAPRRGSPINSAVLESAQRLAEERRRLGWQRFAKLP